MENNQAREIVFSRDKIPRLLIVLFGRKRATKLWHTTFDRTVQTLRFGIKRLPKSLAELRLSNPDD
jgi:hypothetical protein